MKKKEDLRKQFLPEGWYPHKKEIIEKIFGQWNDSHDYQIVSQVKRGISAIVPHAGWRFSGKLAYCTLMQLKDDFDTIAVIGGHLPEGAGIFAAFENQVETPLGNIDIDLELLDLLKKEITVREDSFPDNSVEVIIPMIRYLFPEAGLLWLRTGAGEEAENLGSTLSVIAKNSDKKLAVVGSTDLTHYGDSYNFVPYGYGEAAFKKIKNQHDLPVLRDMAHINIVNIKRRSEFEKSACSAGSAIAAAVFARCRGINRGEIIGYENSWNIYRSDSFVGYGGILYQDPLIGANTPEDYD